MGRVGRALRQGWRCLLRCQERGPPEALGAAWWTSAVHLPKRQAACSTAGERLRPTLRLAPAMQTWVGWVERCGKAGGVSCDVRSEAHRKRLAQRGGPPPFTFPRGKRPVALRVNGSDPPYD